MPKRHILQFMAGALLLASLGTGCERKPATPAVPAPADSIAKVDTAAQPAAPEGPLTPGEYCFVGKKDQQSAECRLTLDEKGEVSGYIRTNIMDSASGQSYAENTSFHGPLKGDTAYVSIDTDKGGGRNKLEEKWVVKPSKVQTPSETMNRLDCQ